MRAGQREGDDIRLRRHAGRVAARQGRGSITWYCARLVAISAASLSMRAAAGRHRVEIVFRRHAGSPWSPRQRRVPELAASAAAVWAAISSAPAPGGNAALCTPVELATVRIGAPGAVAGASGSLDSSCGGASRSIGHRPRPAPARAPAPHRPRSRTRPRAIVSGALAAHRPPAPPAHSHTDGKSHLVLHLSVLSLLPVPVLYSTTTCPAWPRTRRRFPAHGRCSADRLPPRVGRSVAAPAAAPACPARLELQRPATRPGSR